MLSKVIQDFACLQGLLVDFRMGLFVFKRLVKPVAEIINPWATCQVGRGTGGDVRLVV